MGNMKQRKRERAMLGPVSDRRKIPCTFFVQALGSLSLHLKLDLRGCSEIHPDKLTI